MFGLTPYNRRDSQIRGRDNVFSLGNVFDDFFGDSFMPAFFTANPMRADIKETDKDYVIEAEIPGVNKEDIGLDLRDDTLTISVSHDEQSNEERDNYIRKERRYGSYSRSFYVENVNNEKVSAKYNDGILTVTLPKAEAGKEKKHKIDIQ